MNKKIFSFLICILILFSDLSVFASPDWTYDEKISIMYGQAITEEKADDIIQRLLKYLSIIKEQKNLTKNTSMSEFTDALCVITDYSYNDLEAQIEENAKNKIFENNELSYNDAATVGVILTGYQYKADLKGYMNVANEIDLFNGITPRGDKIMQVRELNQFLYNMMIIPCHEQKTFSEDKKTYGVVAPGSTILESRFDIVQKKGILNAVGSSSIYGLSELSEDKIEIDRVGYYYYDENIKNLIGHNIVCFVKVDENAPDTVITAESLGQLFYEFTTADVEEYKEGYIKTTDKTVKYNSNAKVVYNGFYYMTAGECINEMLTKNANIKAIDNNGDNIADVFIIWYYQDYIARYDVGDTLNLSLDMGAKFEGKSNIILSEKENWTLVEILKDGVSVDATEIKSGNVVSVAFAKNGASQKRIKIVVSSETLLGKISEIREEKGNVYIKVGENEYRLSEYYKTLSKYPSGGVKEAVIPGVGENFKLYFSAFGTIAGVKEASDEILWGYMQGVLPDESLDGSNNLIRMFNIEGSFEELKLAKKVIYHDKNYISGKTFSAIDTIKEIKKPTISDSSYDIRQMVCYTLNPQYEIDEIWMTYDNTQGTPGALDYPCTFDAEPTGWYYHGKFVVSGWMDINAKTFIVPGFSNKDDDDFYRISTLGEEKSLPASFDGVKLYGSDKFKVGKMYLWVKESTASMPVDIPIHLVSKVSKFLTPEGEEGVKVYGYDISAKSQILQFKETDKLSYDNNEGWKTNIKPGDLKPGDIIAFTKDGAGKYVENFKVLFRESDRGGYYYKTATGAKSSGAENMDLLKSYFGYVEFKALSDYMNGTAINTIIQYTDGSTDYINIVKNLHVDAKVLIFEKANGTITSATRSDLVEGDKICLRRTYPGVEFIVIYR